MLPQHPHEDIVIDIGEKFPDITLQHQRGSRIIAGNLACELPEPIHRSMRSLVFATGVGVVDKERIEKGIQLTADRMVYQAITYGRFMDMTRLRIIDTESMVRSVPVRFRLQFLMKADNVICQMHRIPYDILPVSLAAQKFLPSGE